ncbi:hypothetical protein [Dendronalium phyllosphericum]|nr:hypothetical protein [Dendronalium phyllosphericum]
MQLVLGVFTFEDTYTRKDAQLKTVVAQTSGLAIATSILVQF